MQYVDGSRGCIEFGDGVGGAEKGGSCVLFWERIPPKKDLMKEVESSFHGLASVVFTRRNASPSVLRGVESDAFL